jgi:hypothetical protein
MFVATAIRAHIWRLPEGVMFARRDLLQYGSTGAVDQTLKRLIDKKLIARLTCGTYIRPIPGAPLPSFTEIAQARITSLGRTGVRSAEAEARAHGLTNDCEQVLTYEVNASSSQFNIHPFPGRPGCVVKLKSRVARKMRLDHSPAGKAIKALWHMGLECTPTTLDLATRNFLRSDRAEFRKSHRWMPGWLSDFVHNCNGNR